MPEWRELKQDTEDIQLIEIAQEGDAQAFGLLYERYSPVIFRFIYAHLSERLDAEDLTEEVFLRVWRTLPKFREQGVPFVAYLFRVSRNAIIDYYRRFKHSESHLSLEENAIIASDPDPSEAAGHNLERQAIRQMLEQLPEDYRTVLVLRFLSDLSPDETAEVMEKSPGAVRVLQHRALASLRKLMES